MKSFLTSYRAKYLFLVLLYIGFSATSRPRFDKHALNRLYQAFPFMSMDEVQKQIPDILKAVKTSPESYNNVLQTVHKLEKAVQRIRHEGRAFADYGMFSGLETRVGHLSQAASKVYGDEYGIAAMQRIREQYFQSHPEEAARFNPAEAEEMNRFFRTLGHFLLWSVVFNPFMLYVRFQQFGKIFWCELVSRPFKVVGACLFTPVLLKYPDETLQQDLMQATRFLLRFAVSALSFVFSCCTWMVIGGFAKAQSIGGKKQKAVLMIDYRRTDSVSGGLGGFSNTLCVQLENAPKLPRFVVLQSLSAFGANGFQSNELVAFKTRTYKGLSFWPVVGIQFNTNNSRGFVAGTEVYFRRGRLFIPVPNIWWERLITPKRTDTLWGIARPMVTLTKNISVGGEVNIKKAFPSKTVYTLGPTGEFRIRSLRLRASLLWKSTGAWLWREQAATSFTLP